MSQREMPRPAITYASTAEQEGLELMSPSSGRLENMGYKQELSRSNGCAGALGISFQLTNPFVGIFTLYGMAIANGGPASFWGIFVVCFGQSFVALVLMHLASKYPVAGSVYQWVRFVAGPRCGCFVGYM